MKDEYLIYHCKRKRMNDEYLIYDCKRNEKEFNQRRKRMNRSVLQKVIDFFY